MSEHSPMRSPAAPAHPHDRPPARDPTRASNGARGSRARAGRDAVADPMDPPEVGPPAKGEPQALARVRRAMERDQSARVRDLAALVRDRAAQARDRRAALRIASLVNGRGSDHVIRALRESEAEMRAAAAEDRAQAAADRARAARDREQAMLDRRQARIDQRHPSDAYSDAILLSPQPQSVGEARRRVLELVPAVVDRARVAELQIAVSEVVGNAIRHGSRDAPIEMAVVPMPGWLHVAVSDHGPGFIPPCRPTSPDAEGGRGLLLVERLTRRWGLTRGDGRTCVWFEFEWT